MMDKKQIINWTILLGIFSIPILLCAWIIGYVFIWMPAEMEAKTFNKFSDVKATTWDAIWVELRVMNK